MQLSRTYYLLFIINHHLYLIAVQNFLTSTLRGG